MTYVVCAQIDESGIVISMIACLDTQWATTNLGGVWLPVYDDNYCGVGWTWDG